MNIEEYYSNELIKEKIFEYTNDAIFIKKSADGTEIFRSILGKQNILVILDIEYFNIKYPAEAYYNPVTVLKKIEPVYKRILKIFKKFDIQPLPILTGRGYHFAFNVEISKNQPQELYQTTGKLLEYISHLLFRDLRKGYYGLPVVFTDLAVGNPYEAISIDISMFGDPIFTRYVRCPFSLYQKHRNHPIPVIVSLPRNDDIPLDMILEIRKDLSKVVEYAKEVDAKIPTISISKLLKSYKFSKLCKFHKNFYNENYQSKELNINDLPPCVSHCLKEPNDHLLKPTNIQTFTRTLLKLGFHPKQISHIISSKYKEEHFWRIDWREYEPVLRADFFVRIFSGLILTGIDKEEDLNCISHAEKGYCWQKFCGYNLSDYKIWR